MAHLVHDLKCWPQYFDAMLEGRKPFELRRDDRGYTEGNVLHVREWDPRVDKYTGRELWREITYVARPSHMPSVWGSPLAENFVILGLRGYEPRVSADRTRAVER